VTPWRRDDVLLARVEALAEDVGRLRRRSTSTGWDAHILDRVAGHVETLDLILSPTAGEVYRANRRFGAGDELALDCALEDVGNRAARLRSLLGEAER
jgi:hypothetical protein